jgi:hypothetical protein
MYFLIETEDQLKRFFKDEGEECYMNFITNNDEVHPKFQTLCALYIYSFSKQKGFIINLNHPEAFGLPMPLDYLHSYTNIFVRDKIKALFYIPFLSYTDIQSYYYLSKNEPLPTFPKTSAHSFYEHKFGANNVNKIIPLVKHYEALTQDLDALYAHISQYKCDESCVWYNKVLTPTLHKMVNEGFKINSTFSDHFKSKPSLSVCEDRIYGWYNYCSTTGRPINNFNSVNFSSLKHDNGERSSFEAANDTLLEIDFEGYHPRIISHLIGYNLDKNISIHTQLAQLYFEANEIDDEKYQKSKELTFQQIYGGINSKYLKHEFFNKTQQFIFNLWEEFNTKGYVTTLIAKRKIIKSNYSNMNAQRLFNYYIQAFETEYNIELISKLFELLENKKTRLILYVYDSFLFDFAQEDGKELFLSIKNLISSDFPAKVKYGFTYSSLKAP